MIKPEQQATTPRRVLLVDDESQVRESLCRVLTSEDFHVTAIGDFAKALGSLESETCDVAVIGVNSMDTAGHQLVRQIKGIHPQVPVVMLTTCPDRTSALEDCVAMLVKPLDVSVLLETVRALSARSQALKLGTVGNC